MERAYPRHDALLREAITTHCGVVSKVIGDAAQVTVPTGPEAVAAALEAQRGLVADDWTASALPEPLRIHMALHAGAIEPDPDGDYRFRSSTGWTVGPGRS
jgi:class 3 adenylate cyclase